MNAERTRPWARLFVVAAATSSAALALEPSPGPMCLTDGRVEDVLVVDDTVYLAGRFEHVRPPGTAAGAPEEVARRWFAACDLSTGEVRPWDPAVECEAALSNCDVPRGQSLALHPLGTSVLLAGKFNRVGGAERRHLARVRLSDAGVEGWDPRANDRVQRVVVSPDGGRIYASGSFSGVACVPGGGTCARARLAAWDAATGDLATGFVPVVAAAGFATVHALALSEDTSTLFVGGQFDSLNGEARTGVGAVDAMTGLVTRPFAPQLSDANPSDPFVQIYDLRVRGDEVYACGDWWATEGSGEATNQRNVNRFDAATGAVDPTFWIGTDGGVQACVLVEEAGMLVVGGHFDCVIPHVGGVPDPGQPPCGGDPGFHGQVQRDLVAMRLSDGSRVDWNPDTGGTPGTWALAAIRGSLLAGGELRWPRQGTATHENLLVFELPLSTDDFESGDTSRWSGAVP